MVGSVSCGLVVEGEQPPDRSVMWGVRTRKFVFYEPDENDPPLLYNRIRK
jgi:hypothetical protein